MSAIVSLITVIYNSSDKVKKMGRERIYFYNRFVSTERGNRRMERKGWKERYHRLGSERDES